MKTFFLIAGLVLSTAPAFTADKRILIADEKISLILPAGWAKTDKNKEKTVAGFVTPDETTSVFFTKMDSSGGGSMSEIIAGTILAFEENFEIKKEDESFKTGQVQGPGEKKWPAIFTTIEAKLDAKPKPFTFKFYLLIFDTGSALYFVQASSTKPVRDIREKQIMELIKSIVAKS